MNTTPRWLHKATLLAVFSLGSVALHAQELVVSAAASLTNAFQAVGQAYEKAHPGTKVTFNFAASGPLLAQIQQGAPVDVFASADQETMDRAAKANLLAEGTRADFARNTLVLIVPASAAASPAKLSDLSDAAYKRISTGTPSSVPVGRYTMASVQEAGLTAALEPKWIYGESVRQVLNYVARAEVDAGFVYRTDALIEREKTRIALTVPTTTPVSYPIAQIASSKNAAGGKDFIAFVRSAPGQQILDGFGFSKP
ncbi:MULTISPECIES: molybdate ABC transporter substrate-binding protein [unclassified Variovorax]|uniref:molybdate ABC transporter substrate-binding protein n=1 Tax=unclassified Variovorax TaxID=663243 RepID=UPI002578E3F4|nr:MULTISPECIES: molybdate ABC transporter substrate-binding protein [unclassified Variovorax]MDM0087776.1 molybdate ABC transporter substrate-binding protein [Variovorax sp. J22G40]MDM0143967.1 molybdate ABC transporter substrate-binding protein [Variovorax sp. J2P1-31]